LSARFSLPYAVAAALVKGSTAPQAFEWDERVAEFAGRVRVRADPGLDRSWPAKAPARVRIRTPVESAEVTVDNPHGHNARPATRAQLRDKFVSLLADERSPPVDELADWFDVLADLRAVRECSRLPLPGSLAGKAEQRG
jgi:2-methylcitrate dehydratase PrpD